VVTSEQLNVILRRHIYKACLTSWNSPFYEYLLLGLCHIYFTFIGCCLFFRWKYILRAFGGKNFCPWLSVRPLYITDTNTLLCFL